jgi:phosphoglycerol transferase MdoB-like AlkP superfamily enzyme
LRGWQIGVIACGLIALLGLLIGFSAPDMAPRLGGFALAAGSVAALGLMLRWSVWDDLACKPDVHADVESHGLVATLLVHWARWRQTPDPEQCAHPPLPGHQDPLVIVIQCESFTDPADLWGEDAPGLPGLAEARRLARHRGRLQVSGFGAYTMRTEYGVLFGRDESQLGLRKFDPFLTAHREASYALANRLDADHWHSYFVHPHDLRFYGRDKLMRGAGFSALIGDEAFVPPLAAQGRYVSDAALTDAIVELALNSDSATLIYAVSIENHGPWPVAKGEQASQSGSAYLNLLKNSDAMLARLLDLGRNLDRPVILCFFGDHRPSIPALSEPADERHTPYVVVDFSADGVDAKQDRTEADLTPAQLHHLILDVIRSRSGKS